MKLKILIVFLLTIALFASMLNDAKARDRRHSSHSHRMNMSDSAPDKIYDTHFDRDGYYYDRYRYSNHEWFGHPHRYYRHHHRDDRRYYDYYSKRGRYRRHWDRYDDDKYYYRGGGY